MDDHSADLNALLGEIERDLAQYEPRDAHLLADTVLHGFGTDVAIHTRAVLSLRASKSPRAAYANARAAFEAAEDMVLLATEANNYDRTGALAYTIELVEVDALQARFVAADGAVGVARELEGSPSPEEIVAEDAREAESVRAGAGAELLDALAKARRGGRAKKHFSALTRKEIADELGKRLPGIVGLAAIGDAFYGFLSVQTHPRLRAWAEAIGRGEAGALEREPHERDALFPVSLTWVAVKLARLALDIRVGKVKAVDASA